jgi:hypothetical protein
MFGTPETAHELLADYYGTLPDELLTDDTNALLGALLMELQAQRRVGDGPSNLAAFLAEQDDTGGFNKNVRGQYRSFDVFAERGEWTQIEPESLGFVTSEVDLRGATVPVDVAFRQPGTDTAHVTYTTKEMPVAGIPVRTASLWIRANEAAGSDGGVTVDCWGGGR